MEGATSNSREFNSRNKQMIGGGGPESSSKRGVGDGRVLPKVLRSINTVMSNTHRRRDETVELRRVGVGGVNTIRN